MDRLLVDVELDRGQFHLAVARAFDLSGITAVFGASGSGKTSLLRVIAGLERNARGLIQFRSQHWLEPKRSTPPEHRNLGYVFQDGRLFPHLDVRGNLEFPGHHGGRNGPITMAETVTALDLEPLLDRRVQTLSGGERQRVAIGRALLANPGLLLMDEPLSSLDLARKRELMPLIRALPQRFGLPILYVTHDLDELVYLADDAVLLTNGRNTANGSPQELLADADFGRLAALENPGTILEAEITQQTENLSLATLGNQVLRLPRLSVDIGTRVRLRVDPRDVILAVQAPQGISIRNRLAAVVQDIEERNDGQVNVRLAVGDQLLAARITADAAVELRLAPDREVFALIKTVALDAFQSPKP
jgi:molybdate transport system ATP-binding protein